MELDNADNDIDQEYENGTGRCTHKSGSNIDYIEIISDHGRQVILDYSNTSNKDLTNGTEQHDFKTDTKLGKLGKLETQHGQHPPFF